MDRVGRTTKLGCASETSRREERERQGKIKKGLIKGMRRKHREDKKERDRGDKGTRGIKIDNK
jgi:hypothetical protein